MKVYISGKIGNTPMEVVERKFQAAADQVRAFGYEPINPLENGLDAEVSYEDHMAADIAMLFKCDGIYLLRDWSESRGARIERNIAEEMGMVIMMQPEYGEYKSNL